MSPALLLARQSSRRSTLELARRAGELGSLRSMSKVPEFWGKDSPYHGDTQFLGTPSDHLELAAKRPVSPHVFEIDGKSFHYKMPVNALSSVLNRGTGVALTVGATGAGWLALTGDLPAAVDAWAGAHPLLALPAKGAVAFPFAFHLAGGLRHLWWDGASHGAQAEHSGPLEKGAVDRSSYVVAGVGALGTLAAMLA